LKNVIIIKKTIIKKPLNNKILNLPTSETKKNSKTYNKKAKKNNTKSKQFIITIKNIYLLHY